MSVRKLLIIASVWLLIVSFQAEHKRVYTIKTEWVNNLKADFSFHQDWSYPEGVYLNKYGQLSCDGLCPHVDKMKDEHGKIYTDSLPSFYRLIDTTHQFHTFQSTTNLKEWFDSDFIEFVQDKSNNLIVGRSLTNAATHVSLIIQITDIKVKAIIELNSVIQNQNGNKAGVNYIPINDGYIKIDKKAFDNDTIKAEFNFEIPEGVFCDHRIFWKGTIHSPIKQEE